MKPIPRISCFWYPLGVSPDRVIKPHAKTRMHDDLGRADVRMMTILSAEIQESKSQNEKFNVGRR